MLKTGKYILIFFLGLLLLEGCKTSEIPVAYQLSPNEVKRGITGSWTKIVLRKSELESRSELSGELIAVQADTLFILTETKLEAVSSKSIDEAILQIYTNQAKKMVTITGLIYAPNILGAIGRSSGAYLVLGIPWILTGTLVAISEGYDDSNLLVFPAKNPLNDFKKFARFPKGMPAGIDRRRFHLL
jgi:hypothetical protein